jgi:uncharacterized protein
MINFEDISGFEWDEGNLSKIQKRVDIESVELAFSNQPLVMIDKKHSSEIEERYMLICLNLVRPIFLVFTVRGSKVRTISARYMHKREVIRYEKK